MLTATILLPLMTGLVVLAMPRDRARIEALAQSRFDMLKAERAEQVMEKAREAAEERMAHIARIPSRA